MTRFKVARLQRDPGRTREQHAYRRAGTDVIVGADGSVATVNGATSIFKQMVARSTNPGIGGSETITGGSGTEILIGGPGKATITGGSGTDFIFGGDASVTLSGSTVLTYASTDIGPTGGGNDTIFAGTGNATIYGGPGNDVIHGGPGADYINGGDTVTGAAAGFDQIVGATADR